MLYLPQHALFITVGVALAPPAPECWNPFALAGPAGVFAQSGDVRRRMWNRRHAAAAKAAMARKPRLCYSAKSRLVGTSLLRRSPDSSGRRLEARVHSRAANAARAQPGAADATSLSSTRPPPKSNTPGPAARPGARPSRHGTLGRARGRSSGAAWNTPKSKAFCASASSKWRWTPHTFWGAGRRRIPTT